MIKILQWLPVTQITYKISLNPFLMPKACHSPLTPREDSVFTMAVREPLARKRCRRERWWFDGRNEPSLFLYTHMHPHSSHGKINYRETQWLRHSTLCPTLSEAWLRTCKPSDSPFFQGAHSLMEEKEVETNNYGREDNAILGVCSKWSERERDWRPTICGGIWEEHFGLVLGGWLGIFQEQKEGKK